MNESPLRADAKRLGVPPEVLFASRLQARAALARRDPKAFFEFVFVEEKTRKRVKTAPHQEVVFDFLQAHQRGVLMLPRDHSKTICIAMFLLWVIGHDPSFRGAVVSATQGQAMKPLRLIHDYVEDPQLSGGRLQLVFPHLRPSKKKHEPWTQVALTVDRPPGTRDPTLVAVGLDGGILGARLKGVFVDDILTQENCITEEQRKKTIEWVDGSVMGTLDKIGDPKAFFCGTAWHPGDLLHKTLDRGWAGLKMDIKGNVLVYPDVEESKLNDVPPEVWDHAGLEHENGHRLLRDGRHPYARLTSHDPDPDEMAMLWPESWGIDARDFEAQKKKVEQMQRDTLPHIFQQMYMMVAHDYANAMCQLAWVEACKKKAREAGVHSLVDGYDGDGMVFVGVDLGIAIGEHNDDTSIFTCLVHDSGHRQILDIDVGKYDGARKVQLICEKVARYKACLVMVESNGGQKLLAEWALDKDVSLPVKAVQTTARKAHVEDGVPGLFLEIYNGAWLIPNDEHGRCDPRVQRFVDESINYVPDKHTGDVLMSAYLMQQGMRQWGITTGAMAAGGGNVIGDLLTR